MQSLEIVYSSISINAFFLSFSLVHFYLFKLTNFAFVILNLPLTPSSILKSHLFLLVLLLFGGTQHFTHARPHLQLFCYGYFGIKVSLFRLGLLSSYFICPAITGMTARHHHTQLFSPLKWGLANFFPWVALEPRSSQF